MEAVSRPAMLVDTHCHLNHADFGDLDAVLRRAREAGVGALLVIGWDLESSERAAALARPEEGRYAAVGIHPHDAAQWSRPAEGCLRALLASEGVVAVGEIGLDFYRDLSPRSLQSAAFRAQLGLAAELGKPVVVHTRESVSASLDELEPFTARGLRGVMHCWSGTAAEARRARALGLTLGVGGVITYRKPGELPAVVGECRLEELVLETDAPYLAPVPYRGHRNEPAYLPLVAEAVARLRDCAREEVEAGTTATAARILGTRPPD